MKPKDWEELNYDQKTEIAINLMNSKRGEYLFSQALFLAKEKLKETQPPHREESNIQDMEILLELFPIYPIVVSMEDKLREVTDISKNKRLKRKI